jgi:hypothetical protein
MTRSRLRAAFGALAATFAALWLTPAYPHAVCGSRIFPATLGIDDPGVGDELAFPTLTYLPRNSDGSEEFDATFNYTKTIFPDVGISIGTGPTWLRPDGYGWDSLDTELKWNFFCIPEHEFMGSVGFDVDWGTTGTGTQYAPYNAYSPVLDVGKGFGDLPTSLNPLRSLAITTELSASFPGQSSTDGCPNSTTVNWGFTIQYSLPYYNANVGEINNDFLKHLIPITEFVFSAPVSNVAPGGWGVTGTIQPGLIYSADKWQFALEAILPLNGASGHGVGVVGELHFYFDDIFPDTLGKPIFASFPGFTGGKS